MDPGTRPGTTRAVSLPVLLPIRPKQRLLARIVFGDGRDEVGDVDEADVGWAEHREAQQDTGCRGCWASAGLRRGLSPTYNLAACSSKFMVRATRVIGLR